jgi:hypothetical protein
MSMASRAEVVDTIRQGTEQVQRTFGSLTAEQLQTQVHESEGGWTAKEVLAHLAGRQVVNDRLLQMASGERASLGSDAGTADWNQTLVNQRLSRSRDALLAEFQAVQEALVGQVQALSDDQLAQPIPLPQGEMPLGDLLGMAGGAHANHHAEEVEQAVARAARL